MTADPHGGGGGVQRAGAPLGRARFAVVMAHGRGGSARDMLGLAEHLAVPDAAYLALQAAGGSWWPQSFLAPLAANEPGLTSGLRALDRVVTELTQHGVPAERVVVLGFSQGACLALEYGARAGRRFRALAGLSGGLIGTGETGEKPRADLHGYSPKRFDYHGPLDRMQVFLGCHERDPHIPLARVRESAAVFERLGAATTAQVYPGAGHGVVEDELRFIRGLLNQPQTGEASNQGDARRA